jgi:transposase
MGANAREARAARGRPRKARVKRGDPITPGMSRREVETALGLTRGTASRWITMSELPRGDFEAYMARCDAENRIPRSREVELLARRQAGKSVKPREHRYPHCGGLIRTEKL